MKLRGLNNSYQDRSCKRKERELGVSKRVRQASDDYEFLDNIDFLKHIDFSTKEGSIHFLENSSDKEQGNEVKVDTDFLEDLTFFDELDYFDQLNRSLERELKELDNKMVTPPFVSVSRWYGRRSKKVLLSIGILLLVMLGSLIITMVFNPVDESNVSYASKEITEPRYPPITIPVHKETFDTYDNVISDTTKDEPSKASNSSTTDVPKQEEKPKQTHKPTNPPRKTNPPKKTDDPMEMKHPSNDKDGFFQDAVFIGNSLAVGLQLSSGLKDTTFLAAKSLTVSTVFDKKVIKSKQSGKSITIMDALKQEKCQKVYVMFGVNELGWSYTDVFYHKYKELLQQIKKVQPDATIYVQSILPVTKDRSDTDEIFNNSRINTYNDLLKKLAKEEKVVYIDVACAVKNEEGALPKEASSDGIHLKKEYCLRWLEYLRKHSR